MACRCCCRCVAITGALVALGLAIAYPLLVMHAMQERPQPPPEMLKLAGINFIKLDDGRYLEYHMAGDPQGTPVLLFQGTLQTGKTVCLLADKLFSEHNLRAICPTLPGYGYSTWKETADPWTTYYKDIEQLASHLGITKFAGVAGWSGGGLPAAVMASTAPDLVGQLLLVVGAPPDPTWYDYGLGGKFFLWLCAHTRITEVLVHYMIVPMLQNNCTSFFTMSGTPEEVIHLASLMPGGVDAICEEMVQCVTQHSDRGYSSIGTTWLHPVEINWSNVANRRVDIVFAEYDVLITPKAAYEYHNHIPGSNLYRFDNATHASAGLDVTQYLSVLWGEEPTNLLTKL
ncbi:hypothetical protein Pelo_15750 [Pelomyxa schiedti]|nr:hypothetical protein Pelo_15750 [Pelomyxa schiedti]